MAAQGGILSVKPQGFETGATRRSRKDNSARVTLDHHAHLIDSSHREAVERAAVLLDRCGPKMEESVNEIRVNWWSGWDSNPPT